MSLEQIKLKLKSSPWTKRLVQLGGAYIALEVILVVVALLFASKLAG
ncbi:hypothetical protein QWY77_06190 [Thalassotalea ponticola]|nr:hypothetical protein [Thalassotalea ponticola]MDN3652350.1 hypothetical protein [Thalassotalea ponticola]